MVDMGAHGMGQARGGAATARATVPRRGRIPPPNFVGTFSWLLSEMTREEILVKRPPRLLSVTCRFAFFFFFSLCALLSPKQTRNFVQAFVGMYSAMGSKGDLGFQVCSVAGVRKLWTLRTLRTDSAARPSNVWWS
jgi:hypothetical protein